MINLTLREEKFSMNKKIISLFLAIVLSITAFAGCNSKLNKTIDTVKTQKQRKPQLVVAMNPIFVAGDKNIIAFNDVKNAMVNDRKSATLTSLSENTNWVWAYKTDDAWKKRSVYGLSKWRNGDYVSVDNLSAYSFTNDGTVSLMPYTTKAAKLETYQDEEPAPAGLLLSVSGNEEETLCYQVKESGTFAIPAGKITAINSVGGVKTGFLAEDGTKRSAVIKFVVNTRVLWEGQLQNGTAGDGIAVTELSYGDITDIEVQEGDKIFITLKLDAVANSDKDIKSNNGKSNSHHSSYDDSDNTYKNDTAEDIPLIYDFESRFSIVYPSDASVAEKQISSKLKKSMVKVLSADVPLNDDSKANSEYEILVGKTNRQESKKAYDELTAYRVNNASDFIIKLDGKKVVIAGNTNYSLQLAVDYFMNNYCKTDKDIIPKDLYYAYRPDVSTITIGNANIATYTIRTEKYPSILTVRAAEKLSEFIVSKTGYSIKIAKDTQTSENEILVGLTTRSGISAETFKSASLDYITGKKGTVYNNEDYNVFYDSSKLFVEAGSDYATSLGVLKLIEYFEKNSSFTAATKISGAYNKGDYTLLDNYAYTWGDEFYTSSGTTASKNNWKAMEKGYTENNGPWYKKTDSYYLASLASLSDSDPNNDFGGPWLECSDNNYVQEGTVKNLLNNVSIRNNMLVQTSKKDVNGYSGSVLCTDGRMEFRYGILETRIMASTANGNTSCFWTRTKDSGGAIVNEIDIMENFGEDKIRPNLHTWASEEEGGHTDHGSMITLREVNYPAENEHFYDTFHHLAVEWTPDFINMYLDGELYLSQDITSSTWKAFESTTYAIISSNAPTKTYSHSGNPGNYLAGGKVNPLDAAKLFDTNNDGKVDINDFYEEQFVDYIRLYQIKSRQYSLKAKK